MSYPQPRLQGYPPVLENLNALDTESVIHKPIAASVPMVGEEEIALNDSVRMELPGFLIRVVIMWLTSTTRNARIWVSVIRPQVSASVEQDSMARPVSTWLVEEARRILAWDTAPV